MEGAGPRCCRKRRCGPRCCRKRKVAAKEGGRKRRWPQKKVRRKRRCCAAAPQQQAAPRKSKRRCRTRLQGSLHGRFLLSQRASQPKGGAGPRCKVACTADSCSQNKVHRPIRRCCKVACAVDFLPPPKSLHRRFLALPPKKVPDHVARWLALSLNEVPGAQP